ncbi:MAG: hypothetical protein ACOZB0_05640 [Pseudomonadota bacterium]
MVFFACAGLCKTFVRLFGQSSPPSQKEPGTWPGREDRHCDGQGGRLPFNLAGTPAGIKQIAEKAKATVNGKVIREIGAVYEANPGGIGEFFDYPMRYMGSGDMDRATLQKEFMAQLIRIYVTNPALLKEHIPSGYRLVERIANRAAAQPVSGDVRSGARPGAGLGVRDDNPRAAQAADDRRTGERAAGAGVAPDRADRGQRSGLRAGPGQVEGEQALGAGAAPRRQDFGILSVKAPIGLDSDPDLSLPAGVPVAKNLPDVYARLDKVAAAHPNVLKSPRAWYNFFADITGVSGAAFLAPSRAIGWATKPVEAVNFMKRITRGQKRSADAGLATAKAIGDAFKSGILGPRDFTKIMVWGALSKHLTASVQEAGFLRLLNAGLNPYLDRVAAGEWTSADTEAGLAWVDSIFQAGQGGLPAQAKANANSLFKSTFPSLAKARLGDMPLMEALTEKLKRGVSSQEIRRDFILNAGNSGIRNKVFSFALLVSGRDDVIVIDRWQARSFWTGPATVDHPDVRYYTVDKNGKRVDGTSKFLDAIYDGLPMNEGKNGTTFTGIAQYIDGPQGLAIYEALERSMSPVAKRLYHGASGVGRLHWESWLIINNQEVGHSSLDAILKDNINYAPVLEGRKGLYNAGDIYVIEEGEEHYYVPTGEGTYARFNAADYGQLSRKPEERRGQAAARLAADGAPRAFTYGLDTREGLNQADGNRGINIEVAPDPRDQEATDRFNALPETDRAAITQEVAGPIIDDVMLRLGIRNFDVQYTLGGFQGGTQPSLVVRFGDKVSYEQMLEASQVLGSLWKQQAVIVYDESDKSGGVQTQFVKVVPDRSLSYDETKQLFSEIYAKYPDAAGFTARDGSLVFGNFSEGAVSAQAFVGGLRAALAEILPGKTYSADTADSTFRSDWIEPVTLEGTRYGQTTTTPGTETGRNDLRGRQGDLGAIQARSDRLFRQAVEARAKAAGEQAQGVEQALPRNEAAIESLRAFAGDLAVEEYEALKAKAHKEKPHYDAFVTEIADEFGGKALKAPVKGDARAVGKIIADYGGRVDQIKDMLRATIVVDDFADIDDVFASLERRGYKLIKRLNSYNRAERDVGYRGGNSVVVFNGIAAELQINTQEMIDAKEGPGHALYEKRAEMDRRPGGRASFSPEDERTYRGLQAAELVVYNSAFYAALERLGRLPSQVLRSSQTESQSDRETRKALRESPLYGLASKPQSSSPKTGEFVSGTSKSFTRKTVSGGNSSGDLGSSMGASFQGNDTPLSVEQGPGRTLIDKIAADFEAKVDAFIKAEGATDSPPIVMFEHTPGTLQYFGWEDSGIEVPAKQLVKMTNGYHGMTAKDMGRLPYLIRRPAMMFGNKDDGTLLYFGVPEGGTKPTLVAMRPGKGGKGQNWVVTAYQPDTSWGEAIKMIRQGRMVYRDTNQETPPLVKQAVESARREWTPKKNRPIPPELLGGHGAAVAKDNYRIAGLSDITKWEKETWGETPLAFDQPASRTYADDMEGQIAYLLGEAESAGFKSIDDWAMKDPIAFARAASAWRDEFEIPLAAQILVRGDSGRQYTPDQRAMFGNVGREVEVPTYRERLAAWRKDIWKKMAQGIADQFRPIRDISEEAYNLSRLSKGAPGALEAFLNYGKLKIVDGAYDADMSGGFIERLGQPLQGELEDFLWWVAANHGLRGTLLGQFADRGLGGRRGLRSVLELLPGGVIVARLAASGEGQGVGVRGALGHGQAGGFDALGQGSLGLAWGGWFDREHGQPPRRAISTVKRLISAWSWRRRPARSASVMPPFDDGNSRRRPSRNRAPPK